MKLLELLAGKKMNVLTDMKETVTLEIAEVKENHHLKDLEPATAANDWWPPSKEWTTYTVTFTNGAKKTFNSISEIDVID